MTYLASFVVKTSSRDWNFYYEQILDERLLCGMQMDYIFSIQPVIPYD